MSEIDKVLARINEEELVQLSLELANIRSPIGYEKEVAEFVFKWMEREGFEPKRIGLVPDRFNVLGKYRGTGGGYSLIFNSHMDSGTYPERYRWHVARFEPAMTKAWREDDRLFGYGVVNDKGPMAAWLIAAKAIKDAGMKLKGDLLLSSVCGEMEQVPVDEYSGPEYLSHEVGARYLVAHGGIADYALVAEATNFTIVRAECGILWLKLTIFAGPYTYTPFIPRPQPPEKSINAIVKAAKVIERIEQWAYEYEQKYRHEFSGGIQVPKAIIGAIRAGAPFKFSGNPEYCDIFLDIRTPINASPTDIVSELKNLLVNEMRFRAEIEVMYYLRGYEAVNAERLERAIRVAHNQVVGGEPGTPPPPLTSMWRDMNCFNEAGIPALSYGFPTGYTKGDAQGQIVAPNYYVTVGDVLKTARVYARTAVEVCNQERGKDNNP